MKVVSIVGMSGSGKSEISRMFERSGFIRVRFGDITDEEIARRDWELNEENERRARELLRKEYGMAVYAELNLPRIDAALEGANVVVDGLYSWEEYKLLRKYYGENFIVVSVCSSPDVRYRRLESRAVRGLKRDEAIRRDAAEIENLNKGGPIAMADIALVNESSLKDLGEQVQRVIAGLR
ncbi:MAG: AAA family ATPase [Dehalococcoidia bacterium]|nr:AAA family ATPase [Dehalococcoidia bacterium]